MNDRLFTFSQFFGLKTTSASQTAQLKTSSLFQSIKQKLTSEAQGVQLPEDFYEALFNMMIDKLDELLAIDIPKDVLATAWSKHQTLQEYRDSEKHPPAEATLLPLVDHTLTSSHKPAMELTLFSKSCGTLELEIDAEFLVNGAILEIQNARIQKLYLSKIKGNGSLKLLGVPFLQKENEIQLPGTFNFEGGVPIPDLKVARNNIPSK